MTPSLEGWPTKAKETTSPNHVYKNIYIYIYIYIYAVFITDGFFEIAIENWPEWDLNPEPLNSVKTF